MKKIIPYLAILLFGFININAKDADYEVAVIGGGPAGLSGAIYLNRAKIKSIIFEGKAPGGQPVKAELIENWPGVKSISGVDLVSNIKDHASSLGATISPEEVKSVDLSKRPFTIVSGKNNSITAHSIIIATGSKPVKLGVPGESEYFGKGIAVCATCDGPLFKDKNVVIIGGGYSALRELGIMKKYTSNITLINPEANLSGPKMLQNYADGVKRINNAEILEIVGSKKLVSGVKIKDKKTGKESIVPADGILVALGWTPSSDLVKGQVTLTDKGQIKVNSGTATSKDGVFAAGDVTDSAYHQLFVSAATGYMATIDAEKYLKKISVL